MERQKKKAGGSKQNPARKLITDKLRYVASCRGMQMNEAWAKFVAPVVQEEFEKCEREAGRATAKAGG